MTERGRFVSLLHLRTCAEFLWVNWLKLIYDLQPCLKRVSFRFVTVFMKNWVNKLSFFMQEYGQFSNWDVFEAKKCRFPICLKSKCVIIFKKYCSMYGTKRQYDTIDTNNYVILINEKCCMSKCYTIFANTLSVY